MLKASCSDISVNYYYRMSRPRIPETPEQQLERRSLAVLVRTLRACVGWSQKDLAEQLGLSIAAIAKLELGIMRLNLEKRQELLDLFEKAGVKFTHTPTSMSVAVNEDIVKKLDPQKALTLPRTS
jgi:transcriptional regulator with XRE-family HTH domain